MGMTDVEKRALNGGASFMETLAARSRMLAAYRLSRSRIMGVADRRHSSIKVAVAHCNGRLARISRGFRLRPSAHRRAPHAPTPPQRGAHRTSGCLLVADTSLSLIGFATGPSR
jgi:hypothetical protein